MINTLVKEINLLYNSQDLQGPEKSDLSDGENIIPNLSGEIGVTSIIDADTYTDTVNLYEVYDIVSNDYYGSAIISFCVNNESPISYSLSGQGSFDQFLSNTRSNLPTNGGYVFEIIGDATNGAVLRVRSIRPEVYECVFSEFTNTNGTIDSILPLCKGRIVKKLQLKCDFSLSTRLNARTYSTIFFPYCRPLRFKF